MPQPQAIAIDTVALDDASSAIVILDQTRLPSETVTLRLTDQEAIWQAIRTLQVRGAPAIGVTAAMGLYLAAKSFAAETDDLGAFWERFRAAKAFLATARPTAVNLFWALDRMENAAIACAATSPRDIAACLFAEATAIRDEDIVACAAIGAHGLALVQPGDGILTHCNAGRLAAVRYGTALAPIYVGLERGVSFRVFVDETRPLLQGARLTAYELHALGIDATLICDNMASQVMQNGWVQAVFVGCDRLAMNGDACNKVGTSGLAILAQHYGIPFYVFAPVSTIDPKASGGGEIPIEERSGGEIAEMWYKSRMAPAGMRIYNPAFDVTDHALISAIVTERGVLRPPYTDTIPALLEREGR